jgi:uncharacterized protein with HEPN domain
VTVDDPRDPRDRRGRFGQNRPTNREAAAARAADERTRTARYLADLSDRAADTADLAGRGRDAFLDDSPEGRHLRRSARMLVIEISTILSERLPETYRQARPDVPWRTIAGMRNLISHAYDGVDDLVLWDVVVQGVPDLVRRLTDRA